MSTFVMHACQKVVKVFHGSKDGIDLPEVLHIISKVSHRRLVERADPDCFNVQVLEMAQFLLDSWSQTVNYKVKVKVSLFVT